MCKACELGNEHIVKLLLKAKAVDASFELENGDTAFSIALRQGHDNISQILAHWRIERSRRANCDPLANGEEKKGELRPTGEAHVQVAAAAASGSSVTGTAQDLPLIAREEEGWLKVHRDNSIACIDL